MCNKLTKGSNWTLITIDDKPNFLPGKNISNLINLFLNFVDYKFIVLNDINGSGKDWLISSLQEKENIVLKLENFLSVLDDVTNFEWGDFFLFKEYPYNWENIDDQTTYPSLIIQSDTTIRAVDNQYMYIYTADQRISKAVKNNYEIESIRIDHLEKLDYPY